MFEQTVSIYHLDQLRQEHSRRRRQTEYARERREALGRPRFRSRERREVDDPARGRFRGAGPAAVIRGAPSVE
jgi:hypothetical protein